MSGRPPIIPSINPDPSVFLQGVLLLGALILAGCASSSPALRADDMTDNALSTLAMADLTATIDQCRRSVCMEDMDSASAVDTVRIDRVGRTLDVAFNDAFAQVAWREEPLKSITQEFLEGLNPVFFNWDMRLTALGVSLETLIPNLYRTGAGDTSKLPPSLRPPIRLTINLERPWRSDATLSGRHIAIWPSHGWYYEYELDRWEWQRARLFQTVEDLFPMSIIVPYLAPMLEGAGAFVHMPRERDTQVAEVIVDLGEEGSSGSRYIEVGEADVAFRTGDTPGFAYRPELLNENPFELGFYRVSRTEEITTASASWIPDMPSAGHYAVYISYGAEENATGDARYTVYHSGGSTRFSVDQRMKSGTWVYLGTFLFDEGVNPETARVDLNNFSSDPGKAISADAVRFGGGMGSISRGGQTSGRPRFTEGARYYMQFAGMPDTLVYNVTESESDYIDDYRGRAEWVNYLRGAPFGPNKDRSTRGLGVPIDLSLAFHTDAGITRSDAFIGTLMIYSSTGAEDEREFPDGMSRFASRDFGDIMQATIVEDLRSKYDSTWTRRAIWDRDYSEAVRPNVPGILLELLSHQNFADMRLGLDPRFRFDVARSVYKGMLRFLASQNGFEPVVQPLPVSHMEAILGSEGAIRVSWQPTVDPLESSAMPDGYVIYTRTGTSGYDNGLYVNKPTYEFRGADNGVLYGFRVAAVNEGGEGMLSEEVSAGRPIASEAVGEVLIVAAFDRISAPASLEYGRFRGFAGFVDEGVPDGYDMSYVGDQYDFDIDSPWLDDDSPGHGASYSTFETQLLTGNTFDYPAIHGAAILAAGYSFSTTSDEALNGHHDADRFMVMDVILGEEKTTVGPGRLQDFEAIPAPMREQISRFIDVGGSVMISGAHVATDLAGPVSDEEGRSFAHDVLGFSWRTDHAVQHGAVLSLNGFLGELEEIEFNTARTAWTYRVESPDALEPTEEARTLMRYADNNMSAVVGREGRGGSLVMGFPFETIGGKGVRDSVMKRILAFLR